MKDGVLFVPPGYPRVSEVRAWAEAQGLRILEVRELSLVRDPLWVADAFLRAPLPMWEFMQLERPK